MHHISYTYLLPFTSVIKVTNSQTLFRTILALEFGYRRIFYMFKKSCLSWPEDYVLEWEKNYFTVFLCWRAKTFFLTNISTNFTRITMRPQGTENKCEKTKNRIHNCGWTKLFRIHKYFPHHFKRIKNPLECSLNYKLNC